MLKIWWQKKNAAQKPKWKYLLPTCLVHFLIFLVCRLTCNVNYNHDEVVAIEQ